MRISSAMHWGAPRRRKGIGRLEGGREGDPRAVFGGPKRRRGIGRLVGG